MNINLRKIYLYIFSTVGLVLTIIGAVQFTDLALKIFVFKKADVVIFYPRPVSPKGEFEGVDPEAEKKSQEEQRDSNRQREASNAASFLIVGIPVYVYHWRLAKKEF
ncbi:MAG: hypothetical protein HYV52_01585 [Parcubacteria group bacterium]|nr:hypothetical protein [Parcubacteria group bacterium]